MVQDLTYTYDPVANVTHIQDQADIQNVVFFRNRRVEPSNDYTYDAIYRIIQASGREQLGQNGGGQPLPPTPTSYNDFPRLGLLHPSDGNAMGIYNEQYQYDAVGNFTQFIHRGTDPSNPGWTRAYTYNETSLLEPGKQSNRLTRTTINPGATQPQNENYTYDLHGNMSSMPQLQVMTWDFKDQFYMSQRQAVNASDGDGLQHQGERTYYMYDASGQRARKVNERQNGTLKSERIYLGAFEVYREYNGSGGSVTLERETLHVMDDKRRIALVETRTIDASAPPNSLPSTTTRYQYDNHLSSACLELDESAAVISYEEYYPYGSSSYQAGRSVAEVSLKRYRYTGKERDEESGLYYCHARYYCAWLGLWASTDPKGITADEINLYRYGRNNPVRYVDPAGTDPQQSDQNADPLANAGRSSRSGPGSDSDFLRSSQPTQIGSDPQLQNLGPTQNAFVPRAIRPYATLELTGSGLLQSPTDLRQGWTGQVGGGAQARFTFTPNLEAGFGGTYGRVFTLNGVPLLGPANVGTAYASLHLSEAQPADTDTVNSRGGGFFGQAGASFGAGPGGEASWFASGAGAYSWGWPNNGLRGLDINAGFAAFGLNQINGVNVRNMFLPFASVNLSLPDHLNLEFYGSLPIATGNLSDPRATGTPLSGRLGFGFGFQIPLGGDYAIGAEIGAVGEVANVHQPNAPFINGMPWLNIGFGAVNRRVDFGDVSSFPGRY